MSEGILTLCGLKPFKQAWQPLNILSPNSKSYGETAQMPRLASAFAVRLYDKHPFLMGRLIWDML